MTPKFRVWDNCRKKMWYMDSKTTGELGVNLMFFEDINWGLYDTDDFRIVEGDDEGNVLMQFTGLQDKDKKDIYEGDILDGHSDGLVKVEWSVNNMGWDCVFSDEANIGITEMCVWFGNKSQVVGNIYSDTKLFK